MPNHWRAWTPGAATPVLFDDQSVLQNWLSQQTASAYVAVVEYDLIERGTVPYGITGGRPYPPSPPNPPVTNQVALEHIKRAGS